MKKLGVRAILYLDDMLVMAPMKEGVRKHLATALELPIALGFVINMKKVCNTSGLGDGLSGFCAGFKQDDHFPTESVAEMPTEGSKQT